MIAMALAARPKVLLADEPTTALDVTTQEQILNLLLSLQRETGMAMVIVTHDLAVVSDICDDVIVMYAGYVLERGTCQEVITSPRHPYTRSLLGAMPRLTGKQLPSAIPGQPPDLGSLPEGCPFAPRCVEARSECVGVDMVAETAERCACPFSEGGSRGNSSAGGGGLSPSHGVRSQVGR
jgi:oligopeptide/dipeptide ABC transporter ATP-binding protein